MHLLAPWWWLLLLPLAGGLIVLYLLKLRRRDFVVPSVFLWEQALQDLQANAPIQKLRKNLLLLLQLLAVLLFVAALSRPAMEWSRLGGQHVVLVIDASASMQSTDVSPSRFAVACREGHKAIEALGPRDNMMIVAVGGATRALTPFTHDRRALHAALNRLRAGDCRADLRGALEMASGLVKGKKAVEKPRVVIISDGALPEVTLPPRLDPALIHFVKVGRRSENVGIVVMDVRQKLRAQGGFTGLLTLKNFGTRAQKFTLELSLDGRLRDAREVAIPAGEQRSEVLEDLPMEGGILEAKLDVHDDLAVDNVARLVLPKVEPVPVLLATTGNHFLHTMLSLDPTLTVTEQATIPPTIAPGTVLIADNVPVSRVPRGVSALVIGAGALERPLPGVGEIARQAKYPTIADWDRNHPVLAHADLRGVQISAAGVLNPSAGAHVLIDSDAGPLAVSSEAQGRRIVCLGWDLHASDFPLRVAFPIVIGNCIDWLSGQRQRAQTVNVRTGQVVQVPLPATVTEVALQTPDGGKERLGVTGSVLPIDRVALAGVYRITGKGVDLRFAANLLDSGESNLLPRSTLALAGDAGKRVAVKTGAVRTERELWRVLLLLVIVLLCVEWWVFHRRIG